VAISKKRPVHHLIFRERFERPGQKAIRPGEEKAVVGDRDAEPSDGFYSGMDRSLVEHTACTVDDEIAGHSFYYLERAGDAEPGVGLDELLKEARYFDGGDIVSLPVMRTCFHHRHMAAGGEIIQSGNAAKECIEFAFLAREEDREAGERLVRVYIGSHLAKSLAVGDDEAGFFHESVIGFEKLTFFDYDNGAVAVQAVANRLDLRLDEPAFRRGKVHRSYKQYRVTFLHEPFKRAGLEMHDIFERGKRFPHLGGTVAFQVVDGDILLF
jgi:hypothetical protein